MSLFDASQEVVFNAARAVFGDLATWDAQNISCLVLYKNPTRTEIVGENNKATYSTYNYSFEYYINDFQGLKELVEENKFQSFTIGADNLLVREVKTTSDGKTYVAYCEKIHD